MKVSMWITIILIVILIFGIYWFFNQSEKEINIVKVTNETFQHEVLESQSPVVVIFCSNELWNRKSAPWSLKKPTPIILAIKGIIKEGQYIGKVKFRGYIVPDGSYNQTTKYFDKDSLCKEINIKWLPTVIMFENDSIIEKFEGGGCTAEESKGQIEQELQRILR
ncbi:hypothetical protein DRP43_00955 [candidate division TA06 bacterium]|uniref:Thioredoxin domain-containing protein n=1 Tax=candidate division TA06 bacterium TaxID=2250710 RepID=A0A660SNQ0_UNCT6|nr:MAG: hypothetical protein DRP43_00955 [candidate division TA06 bacterium]